MLSKAQHKSFTSNPTNKQPFFFIIQCGQCLRDRSPSFRGRGRVGAAPRVRQNQGQSLLSYRSFKMKQGYTKISAERTRIFSFTQRV